MIKNKKPNWVINKEKAAKTEQHGRVWIFGIHAVKEALKNKRRQKHSLILTPNAHNKLLDSLHNLNFAPKIVDPRKFLPPIEGNSVHQGVALEASLLNWGSLSEICAPRRQKNLVLLLDRITDPHNVGAILRSAQVFGATAVIAPRRHSCPETGALAKSASGSLDRQPYLRIPNLARAITSLKQMGYSCIGLDAKSNTEIEDGISILPQAPLALILGSEGLGLRDLTLKKCDLTVKISGETTFDSLNVSNAAALALFLARRQIKKWNSDR